MAKSDGLNIRVALEGGDQVLLDLQKLGKAGQEVFEAIQRAATESQQATSGIAGQLGVLRERMGAVRDAAGQLGQRFSFLGSEIVRVGASIAAAFSVNALINMTSAWADLTGRIRNAIPAGEDAAEVMDRLVDVAQRSYQDINNVADAFATSARSLREMGLSMDKSLDLFEAINNAMTLSGAKGVQAESVMRALTRAMQEGALKGANFQAVLDNGGRVLDVLANHLNTTVAGLTKMAREGRITGKVIQEALLGALPKLREDLEGMDDTIADGFLKIRNAMLQWVGTADEASGVSSTIAQGLIWVAENFDLVAKTVLGLVAAWAAFKAMMIVRDVVLLVQALTTLIVPLAKISVLMLASPWGLMAVGLLAAAVAVLALTGNLDGFTETLGSAISALTGFGVDAAAAGEQSKEAFAKAGDASLNVKDGATAAGEAVRSLAGTTGALNDAASDAAKSAEDLGEKGETSAKQVDEGMTKAGESVIELGENFDSTTESILRMADAAREAQKAIEALNKANSGGGSGGDGPTVPALASGGQVRGRGTSTSDSILAWLSNGEYVVRAKAVQRYGVSFFNAINQMKIKGAPAFASGGRVSVPDFSHVLRIPKFANGGLADINNVSNITNNTGVSGRPLTLTIGDTTFEGLIAPEDVATQLSQYATERQVRRAGRTPAWYRG